MKTFALFSSTTRIKTPWQAAVSASLVLLLLWSPLSFSLSAAALAQGVPSLAAMLQEVTPAVVSIRVSKPASPSTIPQSRLDNLPQQLRRYLQEIPDQANGPDQQQMVSGAGSGVIIDAQAGLIITNHHVIDGAEEILVGLNDQRSFTAKLLGSDELTDLALLKIDAQGLSNLSFADSETVMVGDYAVAIGNPFGIGQTVTAGIVSALGRAGLNRNNYEDFIQTDAAINQGNSGGALVDLQGRLIGINTAIISKDGGSNGIGFAIPSHMVASVIAHLESEGTVNRGVLGVQISDVTSDVASALAIEVDRGALVTRVMVDSAAEKAGIKVADVIVDIDGHRVNSSRELKNYVGMMALEQRFELQLYRNGEQMTLAAVLSNANLVTDNSAVKTSFKGAQLKSASLAGVEVTDIDNSSSAWRIGLRNEDVITQVNKQSVSDLQAFNVLIDNDERFSVLTVRRQGRSLLLFAENS